ncbi:metal ABC transporter substrate-binding protein [Actinobacteria bacterium YIM 96077]|uniref:Metal ABC transporter substrate-binding protein n=1 Tax=Phytoactinopolyspora halophila TaxID=1981511 RepID=A0A329QZT7_9ACTN|nr:metal ABC transporter substrate-binding protein [Phytoactinopolyspora halophila]AYY11653.1 metal ABC transporter substrate-binding protein [Actinobacteria bacterium YIM 96077]RAW17914.1 metal ABC transporter substrate-binding protein [Phytoactinopolyspora halophila]
MSRIRLVLLGLVAIAVAACGDGALALGSDSASDDERPTVMTSFTVLADIARNVGGDAINVESIVKPGAEVHGYEPTPSDTRRVDGADLVLENGLGLELWFEDFMAQVDAPRVVVSKGVDTIPIESGTYEGEANPHAWMSPLNVAIYAENIAEAFAELDPDNAELFESNADAFADELREVHEELVEAVAELPEQQRVLVTCEGAFSYLARDAGLQERYLWPVNSDEAGTPRQVTETITIVREKRVPAVFCESTVSDRLQRQVARESGAEFGGLLYVDSLSEAGGPVPTYIDLIRHDAETIIEGLVDAQVAGEQR